MKESSKQPQKNPKNSNVVKMFKAISTRTGEVPTGGY